MSKDYAVSPGEYLQEWLEDSGTSQTALAARLGVSRKLVSDIVRGVAPVSAETATLLGRVTPIPADSWNTLERAFRSNLARLRDEHRLADHVDDIDSRAFTYLRARGGTAATRRDPGRLVSDFLAFHRCGTWEAYVEEVQGHFDGDYALAALREGPGSVDLTLLSVWLAAGEVTHSFETRPRSRFDDDELRRIIPDLRARSASPDGDMMRDLSVQLAQAGVCLLMINPPQGLPLFGVTRWVNGAPVVQQSGRRLTDGFVIWTLFHELGHVLNDPRGEMHIEFSSTKKRDSAAEKSANAFARQVLFGDDGLERMRGVSTEADVRRAAADIGVSPGVVLHHLHRIRQIPYDRGNQLSAHVGGCCSA